MKFEYYSSQIPDRVKTLSVSLVAEVRQHLVTSGFNRNWTRRQVQDCLLAYRREYSGGLLINQLAPLFNYVSIYGELWDESEVEE